jgi:alanyl-tRNA synthetase
VAHGAAHVGRAPEGASTASYRVIADHLRAASFLVADGVLPARTSSG